MIKFFADTATNCRRFGNTSIKIKHNYIPNWSRIILKQLRRNSEKKNPNLWKKPSKCRSLNRTICWTLYYASLPCFQFHCYWYDKSWNSCDLRNVLCPMSIQIINSYSTNLILNWHFKMNANSVIIFLSWLELPEIEHLVNNETKFEIVLWSK